MLDFNSAAMVRVLKACSEKIFAGGSSLGDCGFSRQFSFNQLM